MTSKLQRIFQYKRNQADEQYDQKGGRPKKSVISLRPGEFERNEGI